MKKRVPLPDNPRQQAMANWIVAKVIGLQMRLALRLQKYSQRISTKRKKFGLLCMMLMSAGYAGLLIIKGIRGETNALPGIQQLSGPVETGSNHSTHSHITGKDIQNIEKFQYLLDSLGKDAAGKRIVDSMLRSRPGLLDSARTLQQFFHHEK